MYVSHEDCDGIRQFLALYGIQARGTVLLTSTQRTADTAAGSFISGMYGVSKVVSGACPSQYTHSPSTIPGELFCEKVPESLTKGGQQFRIGTLGHVRGRLKNYKCMLHIDVRKSQ